MLLPSPNLLVLKVIAILGVAVALFAAGHEYGSNRVENHWLKEAAKLEKTRVEDALRAQGVSYAYELRMQKIEADAASRPPRVVRLCPDKEVRVPGNASKPDGAGADGSVGAAGTDIGPGLRDYALDYRQCAEKLNALQEAIKMVAKPKGK